MEERVGLKKDVAKPKDLQQRRITFDEEVVKKCCNLTAIPGGTAKNISCSPQTCCLTVVNKKHFSGFNEKIFAKFWVYVPKRSNLGKTSAEKLKKFIFFFMDLLRNYVGVIVPSFNLPSTVRERNEIMHQRFRHFSNFL